MSARSRFAIAFGTGVLVVGGAAAAVVALAGASDEPTIEEVATLSQQQPTLPAGEAATRIVDGIGFPDWQRWGWTPAGGRSTVLEDDRRMETLRYRKGKQQIAYSIVAGTEPVDAPAYRGVQRTPPEGKVGLQLGGLPGNLSVATDEPKGCGDACTVSSTPATVVVRKIDGHSVILTAWPVSDELTQEVQDMALRRKR